MKSLRAKMTITIVLVVLGSSVLLSFISYQRAKRSLITQLEDNYAVAAQKYALELTSWISNNATMLDTMAAVLENAANAQNKSHIDQNHDKVLSMYAQLVGIILNSADPDDFDGPGDDGEILEFAPE